MGLKYQNEGVNAPGPRHLLCRQLIDRHLDAEFLAVRVQLRVLVLVLLDCMLLHHNDTETSYLTNDIDVDASDERAGRLLKADCSLRLNGRLNRFNVMVGGRNMTHRILVVVTVGDEGHAVLGGHTPEMALQHVNALMWRCNHCPDDVMLT